MNRISAIILLFILLFSSVSYAEVIYVPNNTVYVAPDPYYQMGQTLGMVLRSMMDASREKKAQEEMGKILNEVQGHLQTVASDEVGNLASSINQYGIKQTMDRLNHFLYQSGYPSENRDSDGIIYIAYAFKPNQNSDCPDFIYEYSINTNTNQCRVITSIPTLKLQGLAISHYTEPQPQLTLAESVSQRLGVMTTEKKTEEGGFAILEISPGGIAEIAGFKEGDVLVKLDTYDMKDYSLDRIISYIDMRFKQKATVKCTVIRQGVKQVISVKF